MLWEVWEWGGKYLCVGVNGTYGRNITRYIL